MKRDMKPYNERKYKTGVMVLILKKNAASVSVVNPGGIPDDGETCDCR